MKWDTLEEEPCSLARTVAVIGDRWSLLILRECFLRKRRFEAFQASLGITRHLLAERLKKLVRFGVLRRWGGSFPFPEREFRPLEASGLA
jgi:DNA-binding HxlR family transcriptional regulator